MEIISAIKSRVSVRKYQNKPVSKELVDLMIEAARIAPSGNNTQPWRFIIVQDEQMRKKISEVSRNQKWMQTAPLYIACVADLESRIEDSATHHINENSDLPQVKLIIRDTTIAIEHLVLQAEELGLSTCWVADFDQDEIRPVLGIPKNKYLVAIVTVGFAEFKKVTHKRKDMEEIVFYGHWGNESQTG